MAALPFSTGCGLLPLGFDGSGASGRDKVRQLGRLGVGVLAARHHGHGQRDHFGPHHGARERGRQVGARLAVGARFEVLPG